METLKDVGDLLKEQLPDVTRRNTWPGVRQDDVRCEDDGRTSGSWQFGFNGRMWLLFDSENGQWTVVPSGSRRMKEKWESDRAVTKFFKKTSMGDCRAWLQDFLVHWEKMLKTRASPTTDPPKAQSRATAIKPITWILPVVLSWSITTGILGGVLYKNRPQEIRPYESRVCRPIPMTRQKHHLRPHSPGTAARVLPRRPEAVCSRPREPPRSAGPRPGLLFVAAAGPAPPDAARDAAGRALAEPGRRDVGETDIREKTEGFKLKTPRREFSELLLCLQTATASSWESSVGWTWQARTAPHRSQALGPGDG
ncbi:hypothetical protein J1605_017480 [Eschrichtius robustus]|uniref:Uncharacterized protein n=1 Tax=Eschrichtius robustus TaxID=9764 RepID=A0AB34HWP3_ESCRO|nr:hypothetical protein J1605_017480 [Eschrichtius robustus]